jgi:sphingolipid 4-desaturase/C4-monooxygenase
MITVNFIRDKEVGIFARAKRVAKGAMAKKVNIPLDGGCADEQHERIGSSGDDSDKEGTRRRRWMNRIGVDPEIYNLPCNLY